MRRRKENSRRKEQKEEEGIQALNSLLIGRYANQFHKTASNRSMFIFLIMNT